MQRVQFDRETMQAYKNNAYVKFDETIRLDRFLDQADAKKRLEAKLVQSELVSCRARIEVLSKGKVSWTRITIFGIADEIYISSLRRPAQRFFTSLIS
jgi:hypothetical protein